jgi:hypothetical protein
MIKYLGDILMKMQMIALIFGVLFFSSYSSASSKLIKVTVDTTDKNATMHVLSKSVDPLFNLMGPNCSKSLCTFEISALGMDQESNNSAKAEIIVGKDPSHYCYFMFNTADPAISGDTVRMTSIYCEGGSNMQGATQLTLW